MSDRVFADCPRCGKRNAYSRAELDQTRPASRWVFRKTPPPRSQEPQEYVVTCQHCGQPFKITVST